jgi:hypothetical protein
MDQDSDTEIDNDPTLPSLALDPEFQPSTNKIQNHINRLHCLHLLFQVLHYLLIWVSGFLLAAFLLFALFFVFQKLRDFWSWIVEEFDILLGYFFDVYDTLLAAYSYLSELPQLISDYVYERVQVLISSIVDVLPDIPS